MSEYYSKAVDCYLLAEKLRKKFGNRIDFYGSTLMGIPSGKYLTSYRKNKGESMKSGKNIPFYFKYSENEFLRISVASHYMGSSLGEKMAALSDFYEMLKEEYGKPTMFYTTKDDDEECLTLQWSFINKQEEIEKMKNGTYFDDAEIDQLIIFNSIGDKMKGYSLSNQTEEFISKQVGLPFELLTIVDGDIENFVMHKTGKEIKIPDGSRIDGVPVVSYEKKLNGKNK